MGRPEEGYFESRDAQYLRLGGTRVLEHVHPGNFVIFLSFYPSENAIVKIEK